MHDNRIKAHIRKGDNGEEIQKLLEHLEQAAIYASDALQRKYFQACVQLIALIHDMGKATVDYQRYLKKAADGEKVVRGSDESYFCCGPLDFGTLQGYQTMGQIRFVHR